MNIPTFLTWLSQTSQSILKFIFVSKWTIPILILLVILYLFWKGLGKDKKEVEDKENA